MSPLTSNYTKMFEPITPLKNEINSRSSSDETLTANEEMDEDEARLRANKICSKSAKKPVISSFKE